MSEEEKREYQERKEKALEVSEESNSMFWESYVIKLFHYIILN